MYFKNPLVPIDFSEGSRKALHQAARMTHGKVTLLYVHDDQAGPVPFTVAGVESLLKEVHDTARASAKRQLEQWAQEALGDEIEHEEIVVTGWPPAAILEQAKAGGHDLVVMATHGRTGLGRAMMGSVAERVVRRCEVPVLTIR
jgi:nucleotide-binding universal stress UspA family protein